MKRLILLAAVLLGGCSAIPPRTMAVVRNRTVVSCSYGAQRIYGEVYRGSSCDVTVQLWP